MSGLVKCACCEIEIENEDEIYYGDEGTYYEGKPLCEACYWEDEPCATVLYGDDDEPHVISYTRNETGGDFRVRWVRTDPWRGYYEVESDVYVRVHEDCFLAYSYDAEELKDFDGKIQDLLKKLGVRYARVFSSSSNIFSTGYDLFVHKEDLEEKGVLLYATLNVLKIRYRDPLRFKLTALTGKDPGDFKNEDLLAVEAFERLLAGEDPVKVKEELIAKLGGEQI